MKKLSFLIFSLLFITLVSAQERAIKITNQTNNKEIVIKENKRVKIETKAGEKISGRFTIQDNETILIKNQSIALTDIETIKRNPFLVSLLTSGFLVYAGALTIGIGAIIGLLNNSAAFLLAIPGAAMVYAGIKSPNFHKKYKPGTNVSIEIISISD